MILHKIDLTVNGFFSVDFGIASLRPIFFKEENRAKLTITLRVPRGRVMWGRGEGGGITSSL